MLGMIKSLPQVFGSSFGLKMPFEDNICGRSKSRGQGAKVSATEFQEQLGAVGGEHLWASFEVPSKALPLLQDCHHPL